MKKTNLLFLLPALFLFTAVSCSPNTSSENTDNLPQDSSNTDTPIASDTDDEKPGSSSTGDDASESEIRAKLLALKESPNYTLEISDNYMSITQYFNPDAWSYSFDGAETYNAYIEDKEGVYELKIDESGNVKPSYYLLNEYYENIFGIYDNITYSFSDFTFAEDLYDFKDGKLVLKDLTSEDAYAMIGLCGYEDTKLGDITSIYFELKEDALSGYAVFSNDNGTAEVKVSNIGTTSQPEVIESFLKEGGKGITRVPTDDELFSYLASLKNLRNYTIEVKSDYSESYIYDDYTLVSKYMKNAYYSHSSRSTEADVGYYQDEEGVKRLSIDTIKNTVNIGDLIQNSQGEVVKDLYSEAIYSFADTYWDYSFEAQYAEESKYRIDDYYYITDVANMTDAYTFRFTFNYIIFSYDEEKKEYNFDFVLTEDYGHIYMRVYDIGVTQIGDLPL